MDRYHSSAIFKGSSIMHKILITTQHDARQRCPALIVLKEESNNNNNIAELLSCIFKGCQSTRHTVNSPQPKIV